VIEMCLLAALVEERNLWYSCIFYALCIICCF